MVSNQVIRVITGLVTDSGDPTVRKQWDTVQRRSFRRNIVCVDLNHCSLFAGLNGTQVSVVQYGDKNKAEFTWKDEQSKSRLLSLVERLPSRTAAVSTLGRGQIKACVCRRLRRHA